MSVSDAAAVLRKSLKGQIVALRLGYRTADDLAGWLEAHADEALAQRLAPVVMRDVARFETNAAPRSGDGEDRWTPPGPWQPHPEWWHSDDAQATEHEVTELVAAFVRALQPEIAIETGSNSGQTTEAIGRALAANGHGHLYSLELDEAMAGKAALRCEGLPVTVICADSLSWSPPGEIGFAWLDSETGIRHLELQRFRRFLAEGAIVGVHDTGPQHATARLLWPLVQRGVFSAITLRTPRGVTFGTVTREQGKVT